MSRRSVRVDRSLSSSPHSQTRGSPSNSFPRSMSTRLPTRCCLPGGSRGWTNGPDVYSLWITTGEWGRHHLFSPSSSSLLIICSEYGLTLRSLSPICTKYALILLSLLPVFSSAPNAWTDPSIPPAPAPPHGLTLLTSSQAHHLLPPPVLTLPCAPLSAAVQPHGQTPAWKGCAASMKQMCPL